MPVTIFGLRSNDYEYIYEELLWLSRNLPADTRNISLVEADIYFDTHEELKEFISELGDIVNIPLHPHVSDIKNKLNLIRHYTNEGHFRSANKARSRLLKIILEEIAEGQDSLYTKELADLALQTFESETKLNNITNLEREKIIYELQRQKDSSGNDS